ncbi:MAG: hypothetical protein JNM07_08010 [Phycisphaerae bacterium]|nr:hypothetical protein [Phycisphaerae bacterium]
MLVRHGPNAPLFDPGWLFLAAGTALLGATVLIPAWEDLELTRWKLAVARAVEQQRTERVGTYTEFLGALERGDETLVQSLAARQLGQVPEGYSLLTPEGAESAPRSASPFEGLEPGRIVLPRKPERTSVLAKWTSDDRTRLWLIAVGALSVLIGLLPPTVRRREQAPA